MSSVSWKQKISLLSVYVAAYFVFYIIPNFYPIFPPQQLPLLPIDLAMPFLPWTFLIYLSDYLLIVVLLFVVNDDETFRAFVRMAFVTLVVCGLFFFLFPTYYPRPTYPEVSNPIVRFCMNLVGSADTPNNCFPSMHVACAAVAVWTMRKRNKAFTIFLCVWALAIFISTMTTKQHYFVDILGGLGVLAIVVTMDTYLVRRGAFPAWFPGARG